MSTNNLPRRLVLVLLLSCAVAYAAILSFGLLVEESYFLAESVEPGSKLYPTSMGKLPILICLGAASVITSTLIGLLYATLGKAGAVTSAIAAVIGVAVDAEQDFFMTGLLPNVWWRLASVSVMLVGALVGACLVRRHKRLRHLWIPVGELAAAAVGLWCLFHLGAR